VPPFVGPAEDYFGLSSALQGDELLIGGAPGVFGPAWKVNYYTRRESDWVLQSRIPVPVGEESRFGYALDLYSPWPDKWALVGNPDESGGAVDGKAYLYALSGVDWMRVATLEGSDAEPFQNVGESVTFSGGVGFVGAPQRSDHLYGVPDGGGPGAVYQFDLSSVGVATERVPELPSEIQLRAAYPNPFNPSTTIPFALPEAGPVQLEVFDTLGRVVRVLVDDVRPVGEHTVSFDASGLASGVYLYRLTSPAGSQVRTMVVLK